MSSSTLVFAYGSNLDARQMLRRCPSASLVTPARLPKHRLAFTRYSKAWAGGVADVVPDPAAEVWGLVWSVDSADLPVLDRFEVVPTGYIRFSSTVLSLANAGIETWIYRVAKRSSHVPPPSRYLEILLRACDEHRFPASHRHAVEAAARFVVPNDRRVPPT